MSVNSADCRPKIGGSAGCVEIRYAFKIFLIKIIVRVQPASGQEGVSRTNGCNLSELDSNCKFVITLKNTFGSALKNYFLIILPVHIDLLSCDINQLIDKSILGGDIIAFFKCCCHNIFVLWPVTPDLRRKGVFSCTRIRNVKNKSDVLFVVGIIKKCDTFAARRTYRCILLIQTS